MLQGPSGDGLDEIYDPEQAANGAVNITDSQYDMLHVRLCLEPSHQTPGCKLQAQAP